MSNRHGIGWASKRHMLRSDYLPQSAAFIAGSGRVRRFFRRCASIRFAGVRDMSLREIYWDRRR